MDCESARAALSAMLDGEQAEFDPDVAERHLAACGPCRHWYDAAARLDRLVRIGPAAEGADGSEVAERVLGSVRLPRRGRWRGPVRVALVVVAAAQLGVGLVHVFGPWGLQVGMPAGAHMSHEGAAFNLAFGVALLLVGLNTRRAATQVPVLGTFVLVLATASVWDLANGAVGWARLATHVPIVLGLALTLTLTPSPRWRDSGPADAAAHPPRDEPEVGGRESTGRSDAGTRGPAAHHEPGHRHSA